MKGNTERAKALCLLSGGLDSCVTLAMAMEECSRVIALHASYGQRTLAREKRAFDEICEHYAIEDSISIDTSFIGHFGGSTLLRDSKDLPPMDGSDESEDIPSTYVPFRNGTLLSIAASIAEASSSQYIYIGAVEEDSSGYPDCREEFFNALEEAIDLGTRPQTKISIRTPILHLKKAEIVSKGIDLAAPLELTWSCYLDEMRACGHCDSCLLRLKAFESAGAKDPIAYRERANDAKVPKL